MKYFIYLIGGCVSSYAVYAALLCGLGEASRWATVGRFAIAIVLGLLVLLAESYRREMIRSNERRRRNNMQRLSTALRKSREFKRVSMHGF